MNSIVELPVTHINELPDLATMILHFAGDVRTFLFYAPMGAGKTTFIKTFCQALGSHDDFSSPTYSIVNEYSYEGGKIYHFDLYRLKSTEELLDLGIEDYLGSGNYCFFEWPEKAEPFVDEKHLKLEIEVNENIRYLRVTKF